MRAFLRHPDLARAEENLRNAAENVEQIAKIVQAKCPHDAAVQISVGENRVCPICGIKYRVGEVDGVL